MSGARLGTARDVAMPFLPRFGRTRLVASSRHSHIGTHLYAAMRPLGIDTYQVRPRVLTAEPLRSTLYHVDGFHLHWPEHLGWNTVDAVRRLRRSLDRLDIPLVWTQHNLVPHGGERDDRWSAVYGEWAAQADLVIHHSRWGMARSCERFRFRPDANHAVIPFGPLSDKPPGPGYHPNSAPRDGTIRVGIAGAPRRSKRVQEAIEVVESLERSDVRLIVLRGSGTEVVHRPDRVEVRSPGQMTAAQYLDALAHLDALLFPHEPPYQLGTGVAGDAIGAGIAAITSDWPFLAEYFDGRAIVYGSGSDDLRTCLEQLDEEHVRRVAARIGALGEIRSWPEGADATARAMGKAGIVRGRDPAGRASSG